MAFDFPASPTVGQQFVPAGGPTYVWNGIGWAAVAAGASAATLAIVPFTASGTWTKQANLIGIVAEVWGAGGCGASAITGNGGGGGGYARKWYPASALGSTVAVTVGLGVTNTNGQDTTFATSSPITGGGGVSGGAGGVGTGGDVNISGGIGRNGVSGVFTGEGGAAPFLGLCNPNQASAPAGLANTGQGGCSGTGGAGVAGGSGLCIVTEYYLPQNIVGGTPTTTPPQGRLTLQTATPVMITTQAAKTTIYYTPYIGDRIPIYDGSSLVMTAFAELSAVTTDTTKNPAAIGASKVNDWFVWNDGGTIRLSHGPDWLNDTTRFGGSGIIRINGIWMNAAIITNGPGAARGTYVGTTRSNASSQLDWIYGTIAVGAAATAFLGVWNTYNRVDVATFCGDTTDSTTSSSFTFSQGFAANKVTFVSGLAEDIFDAAYHGVAWGAATYGVLGIGFDVTNARSGTSGYSAPNIPVLTVARFTSTALGAHFVAGLEASGTGGSSVTITGDAGTTQIQTGLHFRMRM